MNVGSGQLSGSSARIVHTMGADTANGAPSGKTNGASGMGVAAFRRRGEAYRATSSRNNTPDPAEMAAGYGARSGSYV